jgi:hypothetical protein
MHFFLIPAGLYEESLTSEIEDVRRKISLKSLYKMVDIDLIIISLILAIIYRIGVEAHLEYKLRLLVV